MNFVYVDSQRRFSLDIDEDTGKTYVAISVFNGMVEYDEWYEVDAEIFERYRADPALAHDFVDRCKRREMDHLLLLKPGRLRGQP
jgi:hypothetical protein